MFILVKFKMFLILLLILLETTYVQVKAQVKCGNITTEDPCTCDENQMFITINDSVPIGSAIAVFNSSTLPTPAASCSQFNITEDGQLMLLINLRQPCISSASCAIQCGDDNYKNINVIITNVDEHPPVFPNSSFTAEIFENATVSTIVFDFDQPEYRPTDEQDCPDVKSMNYFINKSSDGQDYFEISGGSSGKILLKESVDYEKLTEHEFNITVGVTSSVQGSQGRMGYTSVIIKVLDVDDNNPEFEHLEYRLDVTEETITTTQLSGTPAIRGYDRDKGVNQTLLYSFEDYRNTSDFLQISPTDGAFSVTKPVDRETNSTYTKTIWCFQSDNYEKKASANLLVNVLDINDNLPVFAPITYNVTLVENAVGYVTTVTATDKDIGDNAAVIYETINSAPLEINPSSGEVRVKSPSDLNREESPVVTVLVTARDRDGNYSTSTATISLTLLDVNDNSPEFQEEFYIFHINSTDNGDAVGQVWANDSDETGSPNANVTYEIYPASATVPFVINKYTGMLTIQGVYQKDYGFLVKACDNPEEETDRRCSMANVEVLYGKNITFLAYSLESKVLENMPIGTIFGHVLPVTGDKYFCSTDAFDIDIQSHMMKTNVVLDREANDTYKFYIEVSQYNQPKGNLSVTITVEDVNDNAPRFTQDEFFFSVADIINNNTYLIKLNATDEDIHENANLTFSFQQTFLELFTIDDVSGDVRISDQWKERMVSKHSLYHLIAVVEDKGEPSLSSVVPVYVSSMKIGQDSSVGIPISLSKATIMENDITVSLERQLVEILGFDTVNIKDVNDSTAHIFVKAYMNDTEVRITELQRSLVHKWSPVQDLFRQYMVPLREVQPPDNGLSTSEIALIAIAVVVFFGALIAIIVICKQWDTHVKNNRLYDTLRRPSAMYDSQELRMDFAEEELPSRFSTFKGPGNKNNEPSLEGSFGLGYVNAAFSCEGDDINSPRTPTWSCNDTPRIPRWSTSDSLKDAMASLEELTNRLNTEDNISRVSNMSRSRRSQKSDRSEPHTPRSVSNEATNNKEARDMPRYENIVINSSPRKPEVSPVGGNTSNKNDFNRGHSDNEKSASERIQEIIDSNRTNVDYENVETTGQGVNGDIIQEESTAF